MGIFLTSDIRRSILFLSTFLCLRMTVVTHRGDFYSFNDVTSHGTYVNNEYFTELP